MIENSGLQKIAAFIDDLIVSATYTVDGVKKPIELRRSIVEGSTVKKHIYLNDLEGNGRLTQFELIDKDGDRFTKKIDDKTKTSEKGLLLAFEFEVKEV